MVLVIALLSGVLGVHQSIGEKQCATPDSWLDFIDEHFEKQKWKMSAACHQHIQEDNSAVKSTVATLLESTCIARNARPSWYEDNGPCDGEAPLHCTTQEAWCTRDTCADEIQRVSDENIIDSVKALFEEGKVFKNCKKLSSGSDLMQTVRDLMQTTCLHDGAMAEDYNKLKVCHKAENAALLCDGSSAICSCAWPEKVLDAEILKGPLTFNLCQLLAFRNDEEKPDIINEVEEWARDVHGLPWDVQEAATTCGEGQVHKGARGDQSRANNMKAFQDRGNAWLTDPRKTEECGAIADYIEARSNPSPETMKLHSKHHPEKVTKNTHRKTPIYLQ